MLVFRSLHSCRNPKLKELQVQDIMDTYNLNGLKTTKERKKHPYYFHYFYENPAIKALLSKTAKETINVLASCTDGDNHVTQTNGDNCMIQSSGDNLTIRSNGGNHVMLSDGIRSPAMPVKLFSYANENSKILTQISHSVKLNEHNNLRMSYADFRRTYYKMKRIKKIKKICKAPKASVVPKVLKTAAVFKKKGLRVTSRYSVECRICNRKFPSKLMLIKHRQLCQKKHIGKMFPQLIKPKLRYSFSCTKCTDMFTSQNSLELHLKYDHRPRPTCEKCSRMFDCRRQLINHEGNCAGLQSGEHITKQNLGVIDVISSTDVYVCSKCENPFNSHNALRQHKILLNKRKPIEICLLNSRCKLGISQNERLKICIKKIPLFKCVSPCVVGENDCKRCGKCFQNIRRLNQHEGFCKGACKQCGKMFDNSIALREHMLICGHMFTKPIHKDDYENRYTLAHNCEFCGKTYKNIGSLKSHFRMAHKKRKRCRDGFPQLKYKKKSHNKPNLKKKITSYTCSRCSAQFSSKFLRNRHIKRSFSKILFHCTLCPCRSYSQFCHLNEHMKLKHTIKQCGVCKQIYHKDFNISLLHQCGTYTGDDQKDKCDRKDVRGNKMHLDQNNNGGFNCYLCDRSGFIKSKVIQHLVSHSQVKPYKCKGCKLRFKRPYDLTRHRQTVHRKFTMQNGVTGKVSTLQSKHNIIMCDTCSQYFIGEIDLNKHSCKTPMDNAKSTAYKFRNKKHQKTVLSASSKSVEPFLLDSDDDFPISVLKKNKKTSKSSNGLNCYTCQLCDKAFLREATLTSHFRVCLKNIRNGMEAEMLSPIKIPLPYTESLIKPVVPLLSPYLTDGAMGECDGLDQVMSLQDAQNVLSSLEVDDNVVVEDNMLSLMVKYVDIAIDIELECEKVATKINDFTVVIDVIPTKGVAQMENNNNYMPIREKKGKKTNGILASEYDSCRSFDKDLVKSSQTDDCIVVIDVMPEQDATQTENNEENTSKKERKGKKTNATIVSEYDSCRSFDKDVSKSSESNDFTVVIDFIPEKDATETENNEIDTSKRERKRMKKKAILQYDSCRSFNKDISKSSKKCIKKKKDIISNKNDVYADRHIKKPLPNCSPTTNESPTVNKSPSVNKDTASNKSSTKKVVTDEYQIFPCHFCKVNFDTKSSLKYHLEGAHNNVCGEEKHDGEPQLKKMKQREIHSLTNNRNHENNILLTKDNDEIQCGKKRHCNIKLDKTIVCNEKHRKDYGDKNMKSKKDLLHAKESNSFVSDLNLNANILYQNKSIKTRLRQNLKSKQRHSECQSRNTRTPLNTSLSLKRSLRKKHIPHTILHDKVTDLSNSSDKFTGVIPPQDKFFVNDFKLNEKSNRSMYIDLSKQEYETLLKETISKSKMVSQKYHDINLDRTYDGNKCHYIENKCYLDALQSQISYQFDNSKSLDIPFPCPTSKSVTRDESNLKKVRRRKQSVPKLYDRTRKISRTENRSSEVTEDGVIDEIEADRFERNAFEFLSIQQ